MEQSSAQCHYDGWRHSKCRCTESRGAINSVQMSSGRKGLKSAIQKMVKSDFYKKKILPHVARQPLFL